MKFDTFVQDTQDIASDMGCDRAAVQNAGLITRSTGKAAQAAIVSVRNDRDAEDAEEAVESGRCTGPAGGPDAETRYREHRTQGRLWPE